MTVITASPTSFQQLLQLQRASVEHLDSIRSLLQVGDPTAQLKILEKLEQLSNVDAKTQAQQLQVSNTTNIINEKNVENIKNLESTVDSLRTELSNTSNASNASNTSNASNKSLESKIESLKVVSKESLKTQIEALKTAHEQSKISVESRVAARESLTTMQPMSERSIKTADEIKQEIKLMRADNAKALKLQIEAITTQHNTHTDEQANAVAKVAEPIEQYKSVGEKLSDFKNSVKGSVSNVVKGMRESPGAMIRGGAQSLAAGMVSSGTIKKGGLTDTLFGISKREARNAFVKKQQALDSEKTVPELHRDFVIAGKTAANIKGVDSKIEDFKKSTGVDDATMAKTKQGRALLDEKAKLTTEYAKVDKAGQFAAESIGDGRKEAEHKNTSPVRMPGSRKLSETPALIATVDQADAPKAAAAESIKAGRVATLSEEDKNEQLAVVKEQTTLLSKIEENTRGLITTNTSNRTETTAPSDSGGGGILGKALGVAGDAASAAGSWLSKKGGKLGKFGKILGIGGMMAGGAGALAEGDVLGAAASTGVDLLGSGATIAEGAAGTAAKGAGILGKGLSIAKGLTGGVGGLVGGLALDYASDKLKESGHEKLAATADIGSSAASGAGVGASIGALFGGVGAIPGAAIGGLVGGAYGLYKNAGTLFSSEDAKGPNIPGVVEAAGRSAQLNTAQKSAMQEASDAVRTGKVKDYNSQLDLTDTIVEKYGKDLSPMSKTMLEGQVRRSIQDNISNPISNKADLMKPTTTTGVIVEDLTTKVGALKEQAPVTSNNTVIAPSNTTVNNTTNTSRMFPPARNEDSSMDRYRFSRGNY
jgi:hypothetical protein